MVKHEADQFSVAEMAPEHGATDAIAQGEAQTTQYLPVQIPPKKAFTRFTAAQVEKDCPDRLRQIGKEIADRVATAREQARLMDEHVIELNRLMNEAKELCDVAGFAKFRELFCPQLGKSQAYNMKAIASGKKTFTEHRTEERERKRRTRANKKVAAVNSGTVPENAKPQDGPTEAGANAVVEQSPEPATSRRAVTPGDEALRDFSARVMDLLRRIEKRPVGRFTGTSVPPADLAKIGKFLSDLAILKTRGSATAPIAHHLGAVAGQPDAATDRAA